MHPNIAPIKYLMAIKIYYLLKECSVVKYFLEMLHKSSSLRVTMQKISLLKAMSSSARRKEERPFLVKGAGEKRQRRSIFSFLRDL